MILKCGSLLELTNNMHNEWGVVVDILCPNLSQDIIGGHRF